MSAERLRQAATLLRERAEAATPGPRRYPETILGTTNQTVFGGVDGREHVAIARPSDAAYIATIPPPVALALADWLHQAGMDAWAHGIPECCTAGCDECDDNLLAPHIRKALAVANAILGGAA